MMREKRVTGGTRIIGRRGQRAPYIPTVGMGDIAFLLIIFFMLTTVFRTERGLRGVILPKAKAATRLPQRDIAHIWVDKDGVICINDKIVTMDAVYVLMERKVRINPNLIVSINMDKNTKYGILAEIFDKLQEARALKVNFATIKEKGG